MHNKGSLTGFAAVASIIIVMEVVAFADDEDEKGLTLNSLTLSSGESTTTSGITGIVQLTDPSGDRLVEVAFQEEQAWFIYGRRFGSSKGTNLLVAGSTGYFQGAPWVGPYLLFTAPLGSVFGQNISVSSMQWPGVYLWEPTDWQHDGVENPESVLLGYVGTVRFNFGPVGIYYAWQDHLDDAFNTMPGISYTHNLSKTFSVTGSGTWNSVGERGMLYLGITWKSQKK